jgi:hypothetical protein
MARSSVAQRRRAIGSRALPAKTRSFMSERDARGPQGIRPGWRPRPSDGRASTCPLRPA